MASVYLRGDRWWFRLKLAGQWTSKAAPLEINDRAKAKRYAAAAQTAIDKREATTAPDGPLTFAAYARRWLPQRKEIGVRSWQNEASRLQLHVLPRLGHLLLTEVRPIHVRDLVRALTSRGELSPRTIRDAYGVLHCLFETAISDELVEHNPCKLRRGRDLPKKRDADPEWRSLATYTVREVEQLISDPRIPVERRVQYALKAIGGMRHEEMAALRWRHYDPMIEPLGRLTIARAYDSRAREEKETKSGEARNMPVHPVLATLLAAWKLSHWERIYGRAPGLDDLIVPARTLRNLNHHVSGARRAPRPAPRGDARPRNRSPGRLHPSDLGSAMRRGRQAQGLHPRREGPGACYIVCYIGAKVF